MVARLFFTKRCHPKRFVPFPADEHLKPRDVTDHARLEYFVILSTKFEDSGFSYIKGVEEDPKM